MNGPMKDSGGDSGRKSTPQTGIRAPVGTEKPDPAKLAAIIRQNQAMIDKGWDELRRLDEMLALLDTLKASVHPATMASPEPPPARLPEVA
jgi:hypothetical protein